MLKLVLACLFAVFVVGWGFIRPALAADYAIPEASEGQIQEAQNGIVPLRFLPSDPFYFLITIKEFTNRLFQPSSVKRAEFDLILSGKRLKEAYELSQKNESRLAFRALERYSLRLLKMAENLNKARSQNQEIGPFVDELAENLKNHEVLFFAISREAERLGDDNLKLNFQRAIDSFIETVEIINEVRPGLKDRFKTASDSAQMEEAEATAETKIEPTSLQPTYRPKRIIY